MVTNEQLHAGICALAVAIGKRDGMDWLRAVKTAMDDATPKAAAVESAEGGAYALEQGIAAARAEAKNTSNPMDTASWNACLDFVIDAASATQAPEPCAGKGRDTYSPVGNGDADCASCGESYTAHQESAWLECPTPPAAAPVGPGAKDE